MSPRVSARAANGTPPPPSACSRPPVVPCSIWTASRCSTTARNPCSARTSSPWVTPRCPGANGWRRCRRMADIRELLEVMARLRDPQGGCPWDLEQDFASIAPYTIEEAYEVADAIQRGDLDDLRDELGDLLLQVVFHSRMAEEAGAFAFADVVAAIRDKMLRRHPHVFGDERVADA